MTFVDWSELPAAVRTAVEHHSGPVAAVKPVPAHCDFAAILDLTDGGRVFLKVRRSEDLGAWRERNQARFGLALPASIAPRLLWTAEVDHWFLLGYEHVTGRHPNLAPGSPDLPPLADALARLAGLLTPAPDVPAESLAHRWGRLPAWRLISTRADLLDLLDTDTRALLPHLIAVESGVADHLDGDTLAHTEPVPGNVILNERGVHLIDWSFPARATPWADTAFAALHLVDAGHTPAQAHRWATTVPAYAAAAPAALTAFSVGIAGLRTFWAYTGLSDQRRFASVARGAMLHRLNAAPTGAADQ